MEHRDPPFESRLHAAELLAPHLEELTGTAPVLLVVTDRSMPLARGLARLMGLLHVYRTGLETEAGAVRGHLEHFRHRGSDALLTFKSGTGSDLAAGLRDSVEMVGHEAHLVAPKLKNRVVVLVDDGTTGDQVLRANVEDLRRLAPARLLLVAPVLPRHTAEWLSSELDRIVALHLPDEFGTPESWYADRAGPAESAKALPFRNRWDAATQLLPIVTPLRSRPAVVVAMQPHASPVAEVVAAALGCEGFVREGSEVRTRHLANTIGGFRNRSGASVLEYRDSQVGGLSGRIQDAVRHYALGAHLAVPDLSGKIVFLVDDGLSADSELQATIAELKEGDPEEVVLVAPVLPMATADRLSSEVSDVVTLYQPREFGTPADWYESY